MGIGDVLPRLIAGARRRRLPIAPLLAVSPAAIYLAIIYVFPVLRILILSLFDPGFTLGYLLRLGPWRRSAAFQDVLAWLSLLAMIGLAVETIIIVFINPSLQVGDLNLKTWEAILTAVVSFYFGARS